MNKTVKKVWGIIAIILLLLGVGVFTLTQPTLFSLESNSSLETKVSSEKLEEHTKILSSHERFTDTGLERASSYILEALEADGINRENIKIQEYEVGDRKYNNIIVNFSSVAKKEGNKRYIVGAHYDSHQELPGADDNASGVAGLLEIARVLSNQSRKNNLELVFYSTEEMPNFYTQTMGSYVHAKSVADKNIDGVIILEMIGYFSEEKGSQSFPLGVLKYLYSDVGNYIAIVGNIENIGLTRKIKPYIENYLAREKIVSVSSINAPEALVPEIVRSDHSSYWKFGIPAVMVTDTSFLRNNNYHTVDDTYEKLDYIKMKEVVDSVIFTINNL